MLTISECLLVDGAGEQARVQSPKSSTAVCQHDPLEWQSQRCTMECVRSSCRYTDILSLELIQTNALQLICSSWILPWFSLVPPALASALD